MTENEVEFVDPDKFIEHRAQIELEVEIEKKGLPVIQLERPPIPEIKTDAPYPIKKIIRLEKPEDNTPPTPIKTEQEILVEELKIKKHKNIFRSMVCRINSVVIRLYLKVLSRFRKSQPIEPLKTIPVSQITHTEALEMGRRREYVRPEDCSGPFLLTIKNKKTGVVTIAPYYSHRSLKDFGEDWEVVENLFKE